MSDQGGTDTPRAGRRPVVVVASVRGRTTLSENDVARVEGVADVTFMSRGTAMSASDAIAAFGHADVVAVTPKVSPTFDDALLVALPRLRGLAIYATGYDFVDVPLLRRHGVTLSVLPDYSTRSVAEHTLGLMLSLSRRIHLGNDRSRGLVPADTSLRGFELRGRTLGIVGCGRIGSTVAGLASAFGMTVLAYDIDPKPVPDVTYVDRVDLWQRSDVVTLHCPMEFGAGPMVGDAELARLRPGSLLVNSSRAALVDDAAVVRAVRGGRLRGYAVDDAVLHGPDVDDLLREGRIVQTGHSAWWSDEVLRRGGGMWAEHIVALALDRPIDAVDDAATPARLTSVSSPAP